MADQRKTTPVAAEAPVATVAVTVAAVAIALASCYSHSFAAALVCGYGYGCSRAPWLLPSCAVAAASHAALGAAALVHSHG